MSVHLTPELVTSLAGLVTAIAAAIKSFRDVRRERRSRKSDVERLARAAAHGPKHVAELVDEAERTGEFTRLTPREIDRERRGRARARARAAAPPDT
jgi:hypothetical protein